MIVTLLTGEKIQVDIIQDGQGHAYRVHVHALQGTLVVTTSAHHSIEITTAKALQENMDAIGRLLHL